MAATPPDSIRLRAPSLDEVDRVVAFTRAMLFDLAPLGQDELADEDAAGWAEVRGRARAALADAEHFVRFAELEEPVGLIEARVERLGGVFAPKALLHVSVVYTVPAQRRRGIARALVEAALAWGEEQGCVEARLHVLGGHPARALYEQVGFREHRTEMRRSLAVATA